MLWCPFTSTRRTQGGTVRLIGGAAACSCSSKNEDVAQMMERPWRLVEGAQVTAEKAHIWAHDPRVLRLEAKEGRLPQRGFRLVC